ncbi:hypothetical protein PISMIDRAFT_686376 [Pisolithus microcarpus 441]|uniref:Uncharacterized protein n=1 Tax=Pisolithus microcarpus 441 TaxID=765257 RepID=A0A0C9Z904_9AGAM|nr:hypothetical protein BKA83DRAFT_686376 [Pisolithus microcarpus]KIK15946.1 hypothetical protein PISMIDRAFT_686831 [Pisolithus microcarpus 441]KIK16388.1 hypothetical protein PISMIDRAFT_686376 [Pisolithus microcarpus 441]
MVGGMRTVSHWRGTTGYNSNPKLFRISFDRAFLQESGDISGTAEAIATKNIPLERSC